jgi:hypothetical protein
MGGVWLGFVLFLLFSDFLMVLMLGIGRASRFAAKKVVSHAHGSR